MSARYEALIRAVLRMAKGGPSTEERLLGSGHESELDSSRLLNHKQLGESRLGLQHHSEVHFCEFQHNSRDPIRKRIRVAHALRTELIRARRSPRHQGRHRLIQIGEPTQK